MPNSICTTCTRASVCSDRSYSMAKCDRFDPIFNAVQAAVNTYGVDKQLNVFYGEIGELMTAVADHRRGRDTTDHIAEEMADVLICAKEIMYAFGVSRKDVLLWQDRKLRRLALRLAEQEAQNE